MKKSRFLFALLMAIVMMAMSPQSMWAQKCSTCDGTGKSGEQCDDCNGTGSLESPCYTCKGEGGTACERCNGEGSVSGKCSDCNGTGRDFEGEECGRCIGTGKYSGSCDKCGGSGKQQCSKCGGKDYLYEDCPKCIGGYYPCGTCNGIGHNHQWSGTCQTTDDTDDDGNHCHKYACAYEGCEAYNLEKCTLRNEYNMYTHFSICDVCGHKYNEAEHTWGDWADSQRSCTTCGASETCTEHTWGDWTDSQRSCTTCGAPETCTDHDWSEWTSDSKRYCYICDASQTCTDHDWSKWAQENDERHYRTCSTCYIEDYGNHELTFVKHEAATCSQSGGDVYSCSICGGSVMKNQTDIDPDNHHLESIEPLEGYQHRGTCYLVHEEPLVVTEDCTDADHNGACDKCGQTVPFNVKFHAVYGGQEVEGGLYSSTYFQTSTNNPITFEERRWDYDEQKEVVIQSLQLNDEGVLEGALRYTDYYMTGLMLKPGYEIEHWYYYVGEKKIEFDYNMDVIYTPAAAEVYAQIIDAPAFTVSETPTSLTLQFGKNKYYQFTPNVTGHYQFTTTVVDNYVLQLGIYSMQNKNILMSPIDDEGHEDIILNAGTTYRLSFSAYSITGDYPEESTITYNVSVACTALPTLTLGELTPVPGIDARSYGTVLFTPSETGTYYIYSQSPDLDLDYNNVKLLSDGSDVNFENDTDKYEDFGMYDEDFCIITNLTADQTYIIDFYNCSDATTDENCCIGVVKSETAWEPKYQMEVNAMIDGTCVNYSTVWFTLDGDDQPYTSIRVAPETEVTLHAEEIENCTFSGWYLNNELKSDQYEYSYTMPEANAYWYAKYSMPEGCSWVTTDIYYTEGNGGTATTPSGLTYAIAETGTKVTLIATPNDGSSFLGWTLDCNPEEGEIQYLSTDATYEYTVSGNATVYAVFGEGESLPELRGFGYGKDIIYYSYITVTGTDDDGVILATAVVTEPLSEEGCPITGVDAGSNIDWSVTYGEDQVTVTLTNQSGKSVTYLITYTVKAIVYAFCDANMGYITVGDSEQKYSYANLPLEVGTKVTLTATCSDEEKYEFRGWWLSRYLPQYEDEGEPISTESTIEVTATGQMYVRAVFAYKDYWKLSVPANSDVYVGNEKIEMGNGYYYWLINKNVKENVKVVAHPYVDPSYEYVFEGWYDRDRQTLLSAAEEYTFTIKGNTTLLNKYLELTKGADDSYSTDYKCYYDEPFNSPVDFVAEAVSVNRVFKAATPATFMAPFEVEVNQITTADVYTFGGVKKNEETNKPEVIMTKVEGEGAKLEAYMPNIVLLAEGKSYIEIEGAATFKKTEGAETSVTDPETGWTFKAISNYKVWAEGDLELGKAYGFAGQATEDVAVGEFVRLIAGASGKAGRSYLTIEDDDIWKLAPARDAAVEELPQTITVRFVSQESTGIGTLNTETGLFTIEGWYDLQGRRIDEPHHGHVSVKDGKKVIVK